MNDFCDRAPLNYYKLVARKSVSSESSRRVSDRESSKLNLCGLSLKERQLRGLGVGEERLSRAARKRRKNDVFFCAKEGALETSGLLGTRYSKADTLTTSLFARPRLNCRTGAPSGKHRPSCVPACRPLRPADPFSPSACDALPRASPESRLSPHRERAWPNG